MREQQRLAFLVLAIAGVFVSHTIGYGVAHLDVGQRADAFAGHEYMAMLSWFVGPAAAASVAWLAVRGARAACPPEKLSPVRLTVVMWTLLALQEVGERIGSGGLASAAHEPGVWWSAAAAVLVAVVLVALVRTATTVAQRLARRRQRPCGATRVRWSGASSQLLASKPQTASVLQRGPPSFGFS